MKGPSLVLDALSIGVEDLANTQNTAASSRISNKHEAPVIFEDISDSSSGTLEGHLLTGVDIPLKGHLWAYGRDAPRIRTGSNHLMNALTKDRSSELLIDIAESIEPVIVPNTRDNRKGTISDLVVVDSHATARTIAHSVVDLGNHSDVKLNTFDIDAITNAILTASAHRDTKEGRGTAPSIRYSKGTGRTGIGSGAIQHGQVPLDLLFLKNDLLGDFGNVGSSNDLSSFGGLAVLSIDVWHFEKRHVFLGWFGSAFLGPRGRKLERDSRL